jgi:HAD superfamily hydrolase (TIGR01459 family)
LPAPPILTRAGKLLPAYDVLFCDVWGVVHNGHKAYDDATQALIRYRTEGGTVVLVSNAPVPKHRVVQMLARCAVPENCWDDIVSSGEVALRHIAEAGYPSAFYIGPMERDAAFFEKAPTKPAPLESAAAIVCTGLNNDREETAEDYRDVLANGVARGLPFVCANPDKVVDSGGQHFLCAGALGDLYEELGGTVYWAGKPHISAYGTAKAIAECLRGGEIHDQKALVIGDALRTDIEGARRAGHDAIFIAGGIHRHDTMLNGAIVESKLEALFEGDVPPAIAAMPELKW